ncbi:MAG: hypothetical protein UW43_C0005G0010 [Candidatus Yanofskybacteria bacterium GW2011_GWA1_44_21]|uniref:O-antigen ligase-related domain-containing protein n=2 Tax=Candidatus Yanofskyibacteriota TaxID=1752733 RepID=A0A1F8GZX3_9BACT|nr:MAG: hypothetical protein UW14_C0004G0036 [Candidatus Yanofskybacteria bacterium GW2011_GWA2_44_10]KKT50517.1 MAG: hypothetical protein UW43_C0005G0010 [Candidatus Yanofskybacteria bacterium GW2011_GWA1_44_21]KKT90291.1 MAG: hypothetical protein UW90_C0003G0015 [Candidatus Yanofskybacteria bacterium GW2011_GWB1_45_11]OGN03055.1 MAG: hypothetical protein A2657_00720 [Candidatus Yanofskybacteria bacterium RIFCSPHIGHO2_01_FULL_44_110b]OGN14553.1 MAG: hypothetical protein A3C01_00495 [Candidatus
MKKLNIIFIFELILFFLIVSGLIPRSFANVLALVLIIYALFASVENSTILFLRSIPFFLALPLTSSFDNFNTWRVMSIAIFLKWWFQKYSIRTFLSITPRLSAETKILAGLLIMALLSILPAGDKIMAVKRVIYFLNLSLIGIVAYDLANRNTGILRNLIKNTAVPTIIVAIVGLGQVVSTYFMDIYQFMRIWGENVQCNQFGNQWCDIAVNVGNTWFAYFGEQLSLRTFSLFPDSHSYPIFMLLGLPAIFAISLKNKIARYIAEPGRKIKNLFQTRSGLHILWAPLVYLMLILSGTRGIWAGSIGVILFGLIVIYFLKDSRRKIFMYLASYISIFFLLFFVAFPIFASPQFLVSKGDNLLLQKRVRSIIDFGETSNAQRIEIWKKTTDSIIKHPILGIGIGNYPIVLSQDLKLAKAGSSAHNLYLHVAAEMGIPALILAIWLMLKILFNAFKKYASSDDPFLIVFYGASLLYFPWVLLYLLTDVAVFDERAFLMLAITAGILIKKYHVPQSSGNN